MTEESTNGADAKPLTGDVLDAVPEPAAPGERAASTTVGTGSYVAISCSVMAMVLTLIILAVLFLVRWIT